ncbi:sodium/proton antiporter NhaB [Aquimarina sp. 2201CG5-10]|uniref:sodium/proton antiporter NhaB n=1 Tax=Aquimarina callyspongiae TaxID=3098150 RepID=UPI002AB3BBE6|nr:sodium/proton antiporter NhaB [Aquimarina sp. 2201CG5-10]MDY8138840.1 sodium/proton antiporter NhaB [Aquimarina sp. 2201CG5-10]
MFKYFLGSSPKWFKTIMIGFLIFNVFSLYVLGPTVTAWLFIGEFIFTLAMALKCYPLQSGGILAIEALALGLTHPMYKMNHGKIVYDELGKGVKGGVILEVEQNLEVILLLVFMVAGIYFMKPLLMYIFSKAFTKIKSKMILSLLFVFLSAVLSAFLDALTVTAVLISVAVGFYGVYHKIHSMPASDFNDDGILDRKELSGETLSKFRSFLRSLVMHGVVGTALGGVCTLVGEPQNLLIGERMGWDFIQFFLKMAPISLPVLGAGLLTTIVLELTGWFGFGEKLPPIARKIIESYTEEEEANRSDKSKYGLIVQAISAILLIIGLALHLAPVGFIGLALIIVQTAFMGITEEHQLGKAFEEALPFTGLLVVFFVIVAMIHDQHLFTPIIDWALSLDPAKQPSMFYVANGVLSMISDNVFVATVYIGEVKQAFDNGAITREQFEELAIAINTGTNLPSVATPNGQAAFLFLLTSSLAPLIGLSYGRMVKMAFPYTIVLGGVGLLGIIYFL